MFDYYEDETGRTICKIHYCPICGQEVEYEEDAYITEGLYPWSEPMVYHRECYERENEEEEAV